MSPRKMTRRDALGMIGKTGVMFGAGTCFYLILETSPVEAVAPDSRGQEKPGQTAAKTVRIKVPPEKIAISGSGSILTFRISGPPGRHCGVSFAETDKLADYQGIKKGVGVVGKDGHCTIEVDVKDLPNKRLYLRVTTSSGRSFKESLAVTKPFVVHVSNGMVSRFEGVRTRDATKAPAPPAAAAAE
jgi:hypothetical protein